MGFDIDFKRLFSMLPSTEDREEAMLGWSKTPQSIAIAQSGGLEDFASLIKEYLGGASPEFFEAWFQTPFMHWLGSDPFRRGAFAREAGFTPAALGLWNLLQAQARVVSIARAMFDSPKAGIGQLKAAVRAYEEK